MNSSSGLLTVAANTPHDTYTVIIRATDGVGGYKEASITIRVNESVTITGDTLLVTTEGRAQSSNAFSASLGTIYSQEAVVSVENVQIDVGISHTCVLTETGSVKCWGRQTFGAVGDGTGATERLTPVDVVGLTSDVDMISSGGYFSCALINGEMKCWGYNTYGQLGTGDTTNRTSPASVQGLDSGVAAIATGDSFACALTTNGAVKCWGGNNAGQIGNNTVGTSVLTPTLVNGLDSGVASIGLGDSFACALMNTGGVKCWGSGVYGQLGRGSTSNSYIPVNVTGLSTGVSSIFAGGSSICALKTDGSMVCWGKNDYYQVSSIDTSSVKTPRTYSDLPGSVSKMAMGVQQTCALLTNGSVYCWGKNFLGYVGDSTTIDRRYPVEISGVAGAVVDISSQSEHSCAITDDGDVTCWGANGYGQLGNNSKTWSSYPVAVRISSANSNQFNVASLTTPAPYTYRVALASNHNTEVTGISVNSSGVVTVAASYVVTGVGADTYTMVVIATDASGDTATSQITVVINDQMTLSGDTSLVTTTSRTISSNSYSVSYGTPSYTFSLASVTRTTTPNGETSTISINSGTGVVTASASTAPDTYTIVVRATDSKGDTEQITLTLRVNESVAVSGATTLITTTGTAVDTAFTGSLGTAPYTYQIVRTSNLVDTVTGITISETGLVRVSGAVPADGDTAMVYPMTVIITDAKGDTATAAITITVNAPFASPEIPS
ncbi:MAG: hypothetical protein EBT58_07670 [Betaproteobacteria bacterium]|nr:hypothetical protein [Betaproteobacteria bacterium]